MSGGPWTGSAFEACASSRTPDRCIIISLIGCIGVLPGLFASVIIPDAVHAELLHPGAPSSVREWASDPPAWLLVRAAPGGAVDPSDKLDAGERAAIALALSPRADLVLMDDRAGVVAAAMQGLATVGTIGLLDRAARRGLVEIGPAVARLRATNFRCRPELLDALLGQHARGGGS